MVTRCRRWYPLAMIALLGVLLIPLQAANEWTLRHTWKPGFGNLSWVAQPSAHHSLRLHLTAPDGTQPVEVVVGQDTVKVLVPDAVGQLVRPVSPVWLYREGLEALTRPQVDVVLKFRPGEWALYLANRPVARWPASSRPGMLQVPPDEIPPTTPAATFQKVADFEFHADFMVAPDSKDNPLADWDQQGGDWHIHTAEEEVVSLPNGENFKTRQLTPERSAKFYSLQGKSRGGKEGVILAGYPFLDNYAFECAIRVEPGEAGLAFYYQSPRDFYTLTLRRPTNPDQPTEVRLVRHSSTRLPRVVTLAAAQTMITDDQCVKPRIRAWENHLECYLDETKIFDLQEDLPVGGRFGLYVDAATPIRFDDLQMASIRDVRLNTPDEIRFHTLSSTGQWLPTRGFMGLLQPADEEATGLQPPRTLPSKTLLVGAAEHGAHTFAATFAPQSEGADLGLLCGYTGPDKQYYRFVRTVSGRREQLRLDRLGTGPVEKLTDISLPLATAATGLEPVTLLADATAPGQLRLYRDGELVLMQPVTQAVTGAAGLYLGPNAAARITDLLYLGERPGLYKNKYEKNRLYVIDPFMRHWSSPEGQWFTDPAGMTWYKGDFYGRLEVHLPYVNGAQVHLGVGEQNADGELVALAENGHLSLYRPEGKALTTATPLATATLSEAAIAASDPSKKDEAKPAFALHYEGHWVWATSGDELLFRVPLIKPLAGRRLRVAGLTTDNLMASMVERHLVKDYLFNEAPTDWVRNGGLWEVVNRFQCDPRWSHMTGENGEGIAALWGKYRFHGDFCVEVYAGIRHAGLVPGSWYQRTGDINFTIMNDAASPSRGYTITTTGWDPDHSQLWTTLYRNGQVLEKSDKYLMPRLREGNKRMYLDPLLSAGRDVHGAWYYLKLRRVGSRLEYYFDNQLVFTHEETPQERSDDGGFGLWTFMNSMVVARVKIAAEQIAPRPLVFTPLQNAGPVAPALPSPLSPVEVTQWMHSGGKPLQFMRPAVWKANDAVGDARLDFFEEQHTRPYLTLTNVLGSGAMALACQLPPQSATEVMGWRFRVKRTVGAQFNFYYSVGTLVNGKYTPRTRYFHQLAGESYSEAGVVCNGKTEVPPVTLPGQPWHERGSWTTVQVWLPLECLGAAAQRDNLVVRVEGFGLLQPSLLLAGLSGNLPGDAYAVTDFTPIYTAPPKLEPPARPLMAAIAGAPSVASQPVPTALLLLDDAPGEPVVASVLVTPQDASAHWLAGAASALAGWAGPGPGSAASMGTISTRATSGASTLLDDLTMTGGVAGDLAGWRCRQFADKVSSDPRTGLQVGRVRVVFGNQATDASVAWVRLPATLTATCTWDATRGDVLLVQGSAQYADPRLTDVALTANGESLPLTPLNYWTRQAVLPRTAAWEGAARKPLAITLDGRAATLPWNPALQVAPVLLDLDGLTPFLESFEAKGGYHGLAQDPTHQSILRGDAQQSNFLDVFNTAYGQRLATTWVWQPAISLAKYPLLEYRYRGLQMAQVSMSFNDSRVAFAETNSGAPAVRYSSPPRLDGQWHTWTGMVSDSSASTTWVPGRFMVNSWRLASLMPADQTGLHSHLALDDLVLGPAVRSAEQLRFTPQFLALAGVREVYYAVHAGPLPFAELAGLDRHALVWHAAAAGVPIVPELKGLSDGVSHLYLKAADRNSSESAVTSIPFLLWRQAPVAQAAPQSVQDPLTNGTLLQVNVASAGGPSLDPSTLVVTWNGAPLTLDAMGARYTHAADASVLTLNWPYLLRRQLDAMAPGAKGTLTVTHLVDGAGNTAPDAPVTLTIDPAQDKTGPALLPPKLSANVLLATLLDGRLPAPLYFKPQERNTIAASNLWGQEPFLDLRSPLDFAGVIYVPTEGYLLDKHPYVAFRVRRPEIPADDKAALVLQVTLSNHRVFTIPLTKPADGPTMLLAPSALPWKAQTWLPCVLNLPALLATKLDAKARENLRVTELQLKVTGLPANTPLHLQDFCVVGAWQADHQLQLDAYDASGVVSTKWDLVDASDTVLKSGTVPGLAITPASLGLAPTAGAWLKLHAVDRAGNLSLPVRLPFTQP